jgi:pantetheine-phosphate adenylyltransferase
MSMERPTESANRPSETRALPQNMGFEVTSFSGLLADYATAVGQGGHVVLIRGLRMVSDFESEMTIAAANRKLNLMLSTVFIPTLPDVAFVSSSVVKEIAKLTRRKRSLLPYVPRDVAEDLLEALQPGYGKR